VAGSTRQSKAKRSNGQEEWWTDQVVRPQWQGLDRLQDGEAMWKEVIALVETTVSRLPPNQSTVQKKRRKKKNRTKACELERQA
tara:strand:+ start:979 stop:1230 length:252 start_codon:yes stop_codon:yes gene_type:complete